MISYNYINMMTESVFKDTDNIFHKENEYKNKKCNIVFVTGHSGSGKSTIGKKISDECYSLDDVLEQYRFSDKNFKEYGDLIYSYFNTTGKKFRLSAEEIQNNTTEKTYEQALLDSFIAYSIKYAKKHKNRKYCIEGIQIYQWYEPEEFEEYPLLILGTSMMKSNHRAAKRDSSDSENKISKAIGYTKNITNVRRLDDYIDNEERLNKWREFYSNKQ